VTEVLAPVAIVNLVLKTKFSFGNELDVQDGLAELFTRNRVPFEREVVLSPADRIDFLLENGLGVEVKIDRSLTSVTRQLFRYAKDDRIQSLLLVTSRVRLLNMPSMLCGKPVLTVELLRSVL